jgi:hypothetical protein
MGTNKGTKKGNGPILVHVGRREETVIDYEIVNEEAWERVEEFRMGERVGPSPARNKYRRSGP